jgi:hypothetical protein
MTPPRNPPVYYNNPSYSQPSMMTRDGTLTNTNSNAYLTDLHSVQNKYSHVRYGENVQSNKNKTSF